LAFSAGVVGFVFYKLKDSEPARLAVQSLRQNPTAVQALGEIQKTGWPVGSFSVEGGGSGHASFSISVLGTKAKGKYFVTLLRENNVWRLQSSRLQLADGTSLELGGSAAMPEGVSPGGPLPAAAESGGQTLHNDPSAVAEWREAEWPGQGVRFKVPRAWVQENLNKNEASFHDPERKAYFFGHVAFFNQKLPFDPILKSLEEGAAAELRRGAILGYARRDFGRAVGLLKIERRNDGATMASWEGYLDTPDSGTVSFSFVGGAPSPADFSKQEPILGAIFDSLQFK
jgi:hypothetical protein